MNFIIRLIRKLPIKIRLLVALIVLLSSVFVVFGFLFYANIRTIQFSKRELEGSIINQKIWKVLYDNKEAYRRQVLPSIIEELESLDWNESGFSLVAWKNFLKSSDMKDWGTEIDFQRETIKVYLEVTDFSNLILDPDLDSYYLMDLGMLLFPKVYGYCSEMNYNLNTILQKKEISFDDYIFLGGLVSDCEKGLRDINQSFIKEFTYNPQWAEDKNDRVFTWLRSFHGYLETLKDLINNKKLSQLTNAKYSVINKEYEDFFSGMDKMYGLVTKELDRLLEKRIQNLIRELVVSSFISIFLALFAFSFQYFVNLSINWPIQEAVAKIQLLKKGELNQDFQTNFKDEIGTIYQALHEFSSKIVPLIRDIKKLVTRVQNYSDQTANMALILSDSSQDQASQTEESSAALEEIAASFDKISKLISQEANDIQEIGYISESIAKSISQVNEQMESLKKIADELMELARAGEERIGSTTQSMEHIKEVSTQIGGIVSIITEIAGQTNLLSLNASIEAARAGEMGRGFAVVASEVSKLSEKTSESVTQIKKLIQSSDSSMAAGVKNVNSSVNTIRDILNNIARIHKGSASVSISVAEQSKNVDFIHKSYRGLKQISEEIDSSAKEEKIAIDQVAKSLQMIADSTNHIANNAEALSEISSKLDLVSRELKQAIDWFKV